MWKSPPCPSEVRVEPGEPWAQGEDPDRIQRLDLPRGDLVSEEVEVDVAEREERERRRHLLIEDEEEHASAVRISTAMRPFALALASLSHHDAEDGEPW